MFNTSRRLFLKNSSFISCLPFVASLSLHAQELKTKLFYSLDENKNLYAVNSTFPYEKKLLLSVDECFGKNAVYQKFNSILNVGQITGSDNPYSVIVSLENGAPVLYFGKTQFTSLEDAKLSYVGKLSADALDASGNVIFSSTDIIVCPLVPTDAEKATNPSLELSLLVCDRWNRNLKIISLFQKDEIASFQSSSIPDFQLLENMSFHAFPKEILGCSNHCFLIVDGTSQQHRYVQLVQNEDNFNFSLENLYVLEDNSELQKNWNFRFSSFLNDNENQGDKFHFIFQHSEENKKSIVFLRPDNKLAALEFINNNETISPQVLAISESEYSSENFYFYTLLNHKENQSASHKEVMLCQNKSTQKCFLLSLEKSPEGKYSFAETELNSENSLDKQAQQVWNNFINEDRNDSFNYYLIPTTINEPGISFQIIKHCPDTDEKNLYDIHFQKNENNSCYTPVCLNSLFHKGTPKKQLNLKYHDLNFNSYDDTNSDFNNPCNIGCLVVGGVFALVQLGCLIQMCFSDKEPLENTSQLKGSPSQAELIPFAFTFPIQIFSQANKQTEAQDRLKIYNSALESILEYSHLFSLTSQEKILAEKAVIRKIISSFRPDVPSEIKEQAAKLIYKFLFTDMTTPKDAEKIFSISENQEESGFAGGLGEGIRINQNIFGSLSPFDSSNHFNSEENSADMNKLYFPDGRGKIGDNPRIREDIQEIFKFELLRGLVTNILTNLATRKTAMQKEGDPYFIECKDISIVDAYFKSVKLLPLIQGIAEMFTERHGLPISTNITKTLETHFELITL